MLCLTNIGFVQCFWFGSRKVSYALLLRFSQNFVLRVLSHKHRICALLFPRLPLISLHACVYFALFSNFLLCVFCLTNIVFVQCSPFGSRSLLYAFVVTNLCFVLFASPTSGLCIAFPFGSLLFPSAPLKFTSFISFFVYYSVCFCYACFAQQAPVCVVIFSRLPSNLHASFFALYYIQF